MRLGKHNKKGNGAFALIVIIELLAQIMVTIIVINCNYYRAQWISKRALKANWKLLYEVN